MRTATDMSTSRLPHPTGPGPSSSRAPVVAGLLAAMVLAAVAPAAETWSAIPSPNNSLQVAFVRGSQPVFQVALGGWGPKWSWKGLGSRQKAQGGKLAIDVPFVVDKAAGEVIDVKFNVAKAGPRQIALRFDLSAAKDVPLTMLIASVGVQKALQHGKLVLTGVDGKKTSRTLPFGIAGNPPAAKGVLSIAKVGDVEITIDPPRPVSFDRDIRLMLASGVYKQGKRSITLTLTFPTEVAFLATKADMDRLSETLAGDDWFAFKPTNDTSPTAISMNDWLDKPAGAHGGVRMVGDRFEFANGKAVKFWGTNLSYGGACAPRKKDAAFTASRFAKYGINGVRLHKFTYPKNHSGIGEINDATKMTADGMDRLDYFASEMKKNGVYFGWSHSYGFYVCPGNRDRLVAYDEIARNLKGNTYALINFAPDVQDLMIEMVVNLLKHKNPYTGTTYAKEPALSFIELQNEDDIFFFTSTKAFNACPTYRKLFIKRFSEWLKAKYGSQPGLQKAWGKALKANENLLDLNIVPQTNPWFFGSDHLPGQKGGSRQRLLDAAAWMHETQNKFYSRFVKAIRQAGYEGPICGSPWQAPSMVPHYYNLRSDYLAGFIDRHNYFGGKLNDSMLPKPGSGYFSTGLQQVVDRPFALSEWITVYPSLYSADGLAMVAAYGMGLQGWDASYEFQSSSAGRMFADRAGWKPWGVWDADVPTQIGQYPALARMVLRGDVKESDVISTRRVSLGEIATGTFGFSDKVVQSGDVKSFSGSVPPEALAAGRVVVEFTDKPKRSTFPDMTKYRSGSAITSATKQLVWDTAGGGFFTVNTPGTRAVVGFARGKPQTLGDVTITVQCPYASVFLTATDKAATLATAKKALLCTVARNCNSGFKYYAIDGRILENGKGPILLEPVRATVALPGRQVKAVHVLDHDGKPTGKTLSVKQGKFTIDGARDKTLYYEVIMD